MFGAQVRAQGLATGATTTSTATSVQDGDDRRASATRCTIWWCNVVCRPVYSLQADKKCRPSASASRPHRHRGAGATDRGGEPSQRRTAARMAAPGMAVPVTPGVGSADSHSAAPPP